MAPLDRARPEINPQEPRRMLHAHAVAESEPNHRVRSLQINLSQVKLRWMRLSHVAHHHDASSMICPCPLFLLSHRWSHLGCGGTIEHDISCVAVGPGCLGLRQL
ncbi:hypothetical protein KC19_12G163100 [Ceratodon purpureus]|uniref:Uncharacterized protein n=1 Tax=Ceratodon purpureus TaxID=3225 RepID=A0A8T0GDQ9_CERPU|nr:hypothetical protein KC19_12G163100 [Ceratodon purpureus]